MSPLKLISTESAFPSRTNGPGPPNKAVVSPHADSVAPASARTRTRTDCPHPSLPRLRGRGRAGVRPQDGAGMASVRINRGTGLSLSACQFRHKEAGIALALDLVDQLDLPFQVALARPLACVRVVGTAPAIVGRVGHRLAPGGERQPGF